MIHYIDKDTLLKEIEKLKCNLCPDFYEYNYDAAKVELLEKIENFLNTMEVKEVDLEKEVENWVKIGPHTSYPWCTIPDAIRITAEHFFELGMRVSNPTTAADRGTAEEIIINLKRVEKDYRIDITREIEWLRNKVQKGK